MVWLFSGWSDVDILFFNFQARKFVVIGSICVIVILLKSCSYVQLK